MHSEALQPETKDEASGGSKDSTKTEIAEMANSVRPSADRFTAARSEATGIGERDLPPRNVRRGVSAR